MYEAMNSLHTITVSAAGPLSGTITGNGIVNAVWDGITLTGDNTETLNSGVGPYTLTAIGDVNAYVIWSGDCDAISGNGTNAASCTINTVSTDRNLTASFVSHAITFSVGPFGTPDPVSSHGTVNLSVSASDSLGHALSYAWSASCPGLASNGSFSSIAVQNPEWAAPLNETGAEQDCTITVVVTDEAGGVSNEAIQGASQHEPGTIRKGRKTIKNVLKNNS